MTDRTEASSDRSRVRRHPERGDYERAQAYAILDAGQIAHVGFAIDGQPFVILRSRIGNPRSRLMPGQAQTTCMPSRRMPTPKVVKPPPAL